MDGATVDADGGYWLAIVGVGALRRYLPDGTLNRIVKRPVSSHAKAAFGGAQLETLYLTTTRLQIGPGSGANAVKQALQRSAVSKMLYAICITLFD